MNIDTYVFELARVVLVTVFLGASMIIILGVRIWVEKEENRPHVKSLQGPNEWRYIVDFENRSKISYEEIAYICDEVIKETCDEDMKAYLRGIVTDIREIGERKKNLNEK